MKKVRSKKIASSGRVVKKSKKVLVKKAKKKVAKKTKKKIVKKVKSKVVKKRVRKTVQRKKATVKKVAVESSSEDKLINFRLPQEPYSLVIVESPSKAKTLKKYLGKGFSVLASNGHIKDLPKSKLGVDVKNKFSTDIVPIVGKTKVIDKITFVAKKAKEIYLASDPDREGEAIAYHLAEEIGKRKKIHRVLFNAVTKEAVQEAIKNPQKLDPHKYHSQQTRRVLDRLVGYKISPILWDKVQRGLSAGRVQSVALRIMVERENEVRKFNPEQWFSVHAKFREKNTAFEGKYYGEDPNKRSDLTDENKVKKILENVKKGVFDLMEVRKRERRQKPTSPFTTSKLQQEAAHRLGFSSKKTMAVAQKLYEGIPVMGEGPQGLITYMRTDSVRIEPSALGELRDYIQKKYGKNYLPSKANEFKKKGRVKAQDAHEAIRPTSLRFHPKSIEPDLTSDELRLYSLIWDKFISSQMTEAILDQTIMILKAGSHYFRANGSVIKFPGFRTVYLETKAEKKSAKGQEEEEKTGVLPNLEEGDVLKALKPPHSEEHWTTPPPRYNDASIVKDLEEKGIGRPSTYASIISNIMDRGYVEKREKRYYPTELGEVVCQMLVESFPREMEVSFTADMEEQLDLIEEGEVKHIKVLRNFWKEFEVTLEKAKKEMKNLKKQEIKTGITCTKCKKAEFVIKWGRNGQFLACSSYPECTGSEDFKRKPNGSLEIIPKQYFWQKCPNCKKRLVIKKGKYGRFLVCEDSPKCDTIMSYYLDVKCPICKKGYFAEKMSRFRRIFYGCTSYPDCNNAMWNLPVNEQCPECRHPVMGKRTTKRLGKHLQCPSCNMTVELEENSDVVVAVG